MRLMLSYNCNAEEWVNFEYRVWIMHIENKWVQMLFKAKTAAMGLGSI